MSLRTMSSILIPAALAAAAGTTALPVSAAIVTGTTLGGPDGRTLTSVELDGQAFDSSEFVNGSLTAIVDDNASVVTSAAGTLPSPNTADIVDGDIITGIANFDSVTFTLDTPVVNDGSVVLLFTDIGRSSADANLAAFDAFDIFVNGDVATTLSVSATDATAAATVGTNVPFDLFTGGAVASVADLNGATLSQAANDANSNIGLVAIDLADILGGVDGTVVTSFTIENPGAAGAAGIDVTEAFAVVVPEPGSLALLGLSAVMLAGRSRRHR
ncbi:MAG: PEP-CTERM sorting domain-containing protein [Planctomycetota bacterium]